MNPSLFSTRFSIVLLAVILFGALLTTTAQAQLLPEVDTAQRDDVVEEYGGGASGAVDDGSAGLDPDVDTAQRDDVVVEEGGSGASGAVNDGSAGLDPEVDTAQRDDVVVEEDEGGASGAVNDGSAGLDPEVDTAQRDDVAEEEDEGEASGAVDDGNGVLLPDVDTAERDDVVEEEDDGGGASGAVEDGSELPPGVDDAERDDVVEEDGGATGSSETAPAPTGLRVTSDTDDSVSLSWTAVTHAAMYKVEYKRSSSSTWLHATYTSGTTATVDDLDCYVGYNFRVRARGDGIPYSYTYGDASTSVSETTDRCTAPAPTGLRVTSDTDDSVSLRWTAVTDAAVYKVEYKRSSSSTWLHADYVFSGTTETVDGLDCNTGYDFRVRARGDGSPYSYTYGDPSTSVSETTDQCVAPAPTRLRVTSDTDDSVSLSWSAVAHAAMYKVEYKRSSSSTWLHATYTSGTTATVDALNCYAGYDFRVRARGDGIPYSYTYGDPSSTVSETTDRCDAPAPTGLRVTSDTDDSVSLSWSAVTDAAVYKVEYKRSSSSTWLHADYVFSGTTETVDDLDCDTGYDFRVRARGDGSPYSTIYGDPSTSVSETTDACPPPEAPAPTGLRVTSDTDDSVSLRWTAVTDAAFYKVEYKRSSSSTWLHGAYTSGTAATVDDLDADTGYNFRVRARGDGSPYSTTYGAPSSTVSETTDLPLAPAPTGLRVTSNTEESVSLSWTAVTHAAMYKVEYKRSSSSTWLHATYEAGTTATVDDLDSDTDYDFRVRARGDGIPYSTTYGDPSSTVSETTGTRVLSPPTDLTLSIEPNDANDLDLTFTRSSESTHYYQFELERSDNQYGTYSTAGQPVNDSSSPADFDNRDQGYWYRAHGRNCANTDRTGCGDWSDWSDSIWLSDPTWTSFAFTPSPLALGGTSNVWTVPSRANNRVHVDVEFAEGAAKNTAAGMINVQVLDAHGVVRSTREVDAEIDRGPLTLRTPPEESRVRIVVDNNAFDLDYSLVTLTFHSGIDATGLVLAQATVQKEREPSGPRNGRSSVDSATGSVTLSWDAGPARLGAQPHHYEVVVPDKSNPGTALYTDRNVSSTSLVIADPSAHDMQGAQTAEVRHCNAAGGCSVELRIDFTPPPPPGDLVPVFPPGTTINDQTYTVNQPITTLQLPQATGGNPPLTHSISPALPAGLTFNATARTITGTPTTATATTPYTYTATDSDTTDPDSVSLTFTITVATGGDCIFEDIGDVAPVQAGGRSPTPPSSPPTATKGVRGTWASECASLIRTGRYARYYRFDLQTAGNVQIDLVSSADTYLFLHRGSGEPGAPVSATDLVSEVSRNDDVGSGVRNSRILAQNLAAGTYTIEATTFRSATTGTFTVSLSSASSGQVVDLQPAFGSGTTIPNQAYTTGEAISTLQLPLASSGNRPLTYSITPALPDGLMFDPRSRTITGTPSTASEATGYTYTVTDADAINPDSDTLDFTITVTGTDPLPGAPTGIGATKLSNEQVTLDWDDAANATGYEIRAWNERIGFVQLPGEALTLACAGLDTSATNPVCTASTATVGGLTDRYYYFYIRSRNAAGTSDWAPAHLVSYAEPEFIEPVQDQTYESGRPIPTLQLPEATGRDLPISYSIRPALPAGLTFNASARTVTGTPTTAVEATTYTYTATDGSSDPDRDRLTFNITVADGPTEDLVPSFAPGTSIPNQAYRLDRTITTLDLPQATGGNGTLQYSLSPRLPPGLSFDAAARTITGTPRAESETTTYTFTATDSDAVNPDSASLTFTITVGTDLVPDFGVGTTIPNQTYVVDRAIATLNLPRATGGDGTLAYSISPALPAGLSFDAVARMITGTPTTAVEATTYTYTVTDSDATNPDSDTLTFTITVVVSLPLPATPAGVSGTKLSNERVVIDWDDAAHAAGYRIQMWDPGNLRMFQLPSAPYTLTCEGIDLSATTRVCTESMATVDGLGGADHYSFFVRSWNASGQSGWSRPAWHAVYTEPDFGIATVDDQTYNVGQPIPTLQLPEAFGKDTPFAYTISPALPAGLTFNAAARTITGTPTAESPATTYTYTVTDASANPDRDRLTFSITVQAEPIQIEITGLRSPLFEGESDDFTVDATGLSASTSYQIQLRAVTTDPDQLRSSHGDDIGFNATCSETSKTLTIPGGSASYSTNVTLHACSTDHGGGTVSVSLLSGGTAHTNDARFTATRQLSVDIEIDEPFPTSGQEVTLEPAISGPNDATYTFQWQQKAGATWQDVRAATSAQYSPTSSTRSVRHYRLKIARNGVEATSSPISVTWDLGEIMSDLIGDLVSDATSSSTYTQAETTMLSCLEDRGNERPASLEELLSQYEGSQKEEFDACDQANQTISQVESAFVSALSELRNTDATYGAVLGTKTGRMFSNAMANGEDILFVASFFSQAQSASGIRSDSARTGQNCIENLVNTNRDLTYWVDAVNCLVLRSNTPQSWWEALAADKEGQAGDDYLDALNSYTRLHSGDFECSEGPLDLPHIERFLAGDTPFSWRVTPNVLQRILGGEDVSGAPLDVCLKHDFTWSSLQRINPLSGDEPDGIDSVWTPRNKYLADQQFLLDYSPAVGGWTGWLKYAARKTIHRVYYEILRAITFGMPITAQDKAHVIANWSYMVCDYPGITRVTLSDSSHPDLEIAFDMAEGCVPGIKPRALVVRVKYVYRGIEYAGTLRTRSGISWDSNRNQYVGLLRGYLAGWDSIEIEEYYLGPTDIIIGPSFYPAKEADFSYNRSQ